MPERLPSYRLSAEVVLYRKAFAHITSYGYQNMARDSVYLIATTQIGETILAFAAIPISAHLTQHEQLSGHTMFHSWKRTPAKKAPVSASAI